MAYDTGVNGAGDAVVLLDVQARQLVGVQDGGLLNITSGGGINHVADGELADGLILRGATRAVGAADGGGVATTVLGTTVVAALGRHLDKLY